MTFLSLVQSGGRILLDGAMGTELARRGLTMGGQSNLSNPEAVLEIHREYAACGCHALITNTLTMNRICIETHQVGVDVRKVNRAGAELARQAAGKDLFVLGDMSSTGQLLEPYGEYPEQQFHDTFREQAAILGDCGVDGFIIESMMDLREALSALRACKEAAALPVLVSMAFATVLNSGRTVMGHSAGECARALTEAGADAVGANCGSLGPTETASVISLVREATPLPIVVQPNAGIPRLVEGRTVFDLPPEDFAVGTAECVAAGAGIIGGCCGTTPAHIRAVRTLVLGA